MRNEQKRPEMNRPNPETLSQPLITTTTLFDAPLFVRLAWLRWDQAATKANEIAPGSYPQAVSAAWSIWAEWHV